MIENQRRLPSLNALRVFEVVVRHLSFRSAAEELGVTQGAVAQQIRGLEVELRVRLFDRLPRALALTEAGRSYVANIRRAFELIAEATEVLRPEPRHLTISVTPTFASRWLIPHLPDFVAAHSGIDLRIMASERIASFQTDAVDLTVRYGCPPFGPGLHVELLFEHVLIAVGSPLLIEKLGMPEMAGDLMRYPLLHDAHDLWPQFLHLTFPKALPDTSKNMRFSQTSLAIEAAIAGQGLALASLIFVEDDIASGRLVRLFDTQLRTGSDFYVISPRKPRRPDSVFEVRQWLSSIANGRPSSWRGSPDIPQSARKFRAGDSGE